jgi:GT2 family glycosyltransferase
MENPGITTVIVTYGMAPMLEVCLHHLQHALNFERNAARDHIVVVDNASDGPYERAAFARYGVEWLRYDTHHSFAASCNAGMQKFPNDLYLMLNNDVFLREEAVQNMVRALGAEPRIGICGARLVYPNGTIQHAGLRFGPREMGPYHVYRKKDSSLVPRSETEFQAVTGACMLIRREVADELSGFDESFPFAWEDVDLCLRARQKGWRVICSQEVDSLHFESMTPGRLEKDPPSQDIFRRRWEGRWAVDG